MIPPKTELHKVFRYILIQPCTLVYKPSLDPVIILNSSLTTFWFFQIKVISLVSLSKLSYSARLSCIIQYIFTAAPGGFYYSLTHELLRGQETLSSLRFASIWFLTCSIRSWRFSCVRPEVETGSKIFKKTLYGLA